MFYWGSLQEIALWKRSLQILRGMSKGSNNKFLATPVVIEDIMCQASRPDRKSPRQYFLHPVLRKFRFSPELRCFFSSNDKYVGYHHTFTSIPHSRKLKTKCEAEIAHLCGLLVYLHSFPLLLPSASISTWLLLINEVFLLALNCL